MFSRRDVIKTMAGFGTFLLTPFDKFLQRRREFLSDIDLTGELYAGFVLLSDGTSAPNWIEAPKWGTPHACGVPNKNGKEQPATAVTKSFASLNELTLQSEIPYYVLDGIPDKCHFSLGTTTRHENGELYSIGVSYTRFNEEYKREEPVIRLSARPDFSRPYPLWYPPNNSIDDSQLYLEKVDYLPSPGVIFFTPVGYVFHWIIKDVLYVLVVENDLDREKAEALARTLMYVE